MKHYEEEEAFHSRDKKQFRKERRLAQKTDRSKFKKTDLPNKKKIEPASSLPRGRVIAITGEGAWVADEEQTFLCSLKGLLKKDTGQVKNLIAVGDWVRFTQDGAIEEIEKRTSVLARMDISGRKEQLIAVNVDLALIVVSVVNPPLKPSLIDRYLIAAEKGNILPIIVINKIDLLSEGAEEEKIRYRDFLSAYEPLGWPILSLSVKTQVGLDALRLLLRGKTSVFSGQSGVGKSSLLNSCFGFTQKIGDLAMKTSKGSHTTSTAQLLALPEGGYCVDTPGIRSFGIWNLTKQDIIGHFQDLALLQKKCRYPNCLHIHEPECAVQKALEKGTIPLLRYESYLHLIEEITNKSKTKTWN